MESQNRSAIASWVVPSAFLMIVVVVMLFNFSTKSSAEAADTVSRNIIKSAQSYGEKFTHEMEMLAKVARPVKILLEQDATWDVARAVNMAGILDSCTESERIILCDGEGNGVDQTGETVSVGSEEYFQSVLQGDGITYMYYETQTADGKLQPQIIVVERIVRESGTNYLLLFYPMDKFAGLMTKSDFDSNSFLTVVDAEGRILGTAGAKTSELLKGDNLLDTIKTENSDAARTIRNRLDNGSRGTTAVTVSGESCMLAYVPLGINQWEVILGVSQSYVDKQVGLQWKNTKDMLLYLVIAIFVFICMVVIINIIGKIRNNNKKKELEDKADTDLLTGLTNKLATERKIKEFMAQNPNSQSMMFMVDIDNFKKINDTMGHAFGDEVLRSLGQQIGALFRATDIIGRVGGDEFMIFLKGVNDADSVRKEAKKVEHFFNNFQAGEYVKYAATASIGVAVFPQEGADFETLYKAADQGVYKAKKRGKNQLAFYREEWMEPKSEQE